MTPLTLDNQTDMTVPALSAPRRLGMFVTGSIGVHISLLYLIMLSPPLLTVPATSSSPLQVHLSGTGHDAESQTAGTAITSSAVPRQSHEAKAAAPPTVQAPKLVTAANSEPVSITPRAIQIQHAANTGAATASRLIEQQRMTTTTPPAVPDQVAFITNPPANKLDGSEKPARTNRDNEPQQMATRTARTTPVSMAADDTALSSIAKATQPAAQTTDSQASVPSLLDQVQQQLAAHLHYPLRARRKGWEGRVLIGFEVDTHGSLDKVHLAQSSGYSLLDDSAMAAMEKVRHLSMPSAPGAMSRVNMQVPVIFRLRDS